MRAGAGFWRALQPVERLATFSFALSSASGPQDGIVTRSLQFGLVGCALVLTLAPGSAQSPCDSTLRPAEAPTLGYRDRQGRCEGKYERPVSASVALVGLLAAVATDDLCAGARSAHLVWSAPSALPEGPPVHVRVESLRDGLPYRLDASRPAGSPSFEWPSQPRCSNEVRLRASELGVLARTSFQRGAKPIDVLLPVAVGSDPKVTLSPPYRAILISGRPIAQVHVSLWHVGDPQNPARIFTERPLPKKGYPARTPIHVEMSATDLQATGLYRVRFSVEFEGGEHDARDYFFFHGR